MPRIDAHHHLWDLGLRDQPWIAGPSMTAIRRDFTVDDLRPAARAAGVSGTVVVQTASVVEETLELLELAQREDLVAGVVGWADLTAPGIADALAKLRAARGGEHLAGLRHPVHTEADPLWLCRPDVLRGLTAVRDAGLAFDLLIRPHHLAAAVRAARAVPGLTFVLDHLAAPRPADGGFGTWAADVRALAAEPGTFCKLSGMLTAAPREAWTPYAEVVLEAFGPRRVMFGSDWPVCLLAASYAEVVAAAEGLTGDLPDEDREAVFGGTAARAYQLAPP
ncbi:amidohydrolase family protein [Actinoallomurus iriomotensis]|uniref:Amidohydrolase n=1 Tax=Actinoallomurus iriomotensis TaxID=478107 RepID=A0A9W6S1P9_9ACTN|nr:amidohydrolase family protein [Actinoallomurus iriomotensis]GLY85484.1 amidohydrolase [Actinoallomurus iriomotensis]